MVYLFYFNCNRKNTDFQIRMDGSKPNAVIKVDIYNSVYCDWLRLKWFIYDLNIKRYGYFMQTQNHFWLEEILKKPQVTRHKCVYPHCALPLEQSRPDDAAVLLYF